MMRKCSCVGFCTQHFPSLFPWLFHLPSEICCCFLWTILCVLRAVNGSEWRFAAYENEITFFCRVCGKWYSQQTATPHCSGLLSPQLIVAQNVVWCQSLSLLPENDYNAGGVGHWEMENGKYGTRICVHLSGVINAGLLLRPDFDRLFCIIFLGTHLFSYKYSSPG